MHIWSISFGLALICFTSSVRSQECRSDQQCNGDKKCCFGIGVCVLRFNFCKICSDDSDCKDRPIAPITYPDYTFQPFTDFPTFNFPTYNPSNDYCVWDSDCSGALVCQDGRCEEIEYDTEDTGRFSWSGSKVIGVIFFVAIATVISCLYHMCRRARKPRVPATHNAQPTTRPAATEASNTAYATGVEMQPGSAVSNGVTVIDVEENSPPLPPLPADAPPPYSSLEFRRQGNDNDEPEQPPPSYDDAIRNSSMALV